MSVGLGIGIIKIIKSNVIPKLVKIVNKAFSEKYLLLTNVGLSVTLSGVGDAIEQRYEIFTRQQNKWDKTRTINMSISGVSLGVVCHYWYRYLDKFLPGYSIRMVLKKIAMDQFIGSPIFIFTFFATVGMLENSTKDAFIQELKHKAWKLYAAEWTIWPPAQFVNFYLLPNKYRVLFDGSISLVYDIFTSHVKYNEPVVNSTNKKIS